MNEGYDGYTEHSGVSDNVDITLLFILCTAWYGRSFLSTFSVCLYLSCGNNYDYKRARRL